MRVRGPDMEAAREQRYVHNEEVFRRANERLHQDWAQMGMESGSEALFLCECGDVTCREAMRIRISEYEAIRTDPAAFIVMPGHEDTALESVDESAGAKDGRYLVVRKNGDAS